MTGWYVVHVASGSELEVAAKLETQDIPALVPRERYMLRKGGAWCEIVRSLMPGYVFFPAEWSADIWRKIRDIPDVIRVLPNPLEPTPLSAVEAESILQLCPDTDPLGVSQVVREGDAVTIVSGALKHFEGNLVKLNLRQRRATVRLTIFGQPREITLAVNAITKSDADMG